MIGDILERYTYDYLMQLALSYVSDDIDKREGSIIYDALAPFCQVLAMSFMELKNFYNDTYILTAEGEALDNIVAERGLTRYEATYAIKKGTFTDAKGNAMSVDIGSRFSTVSDTRPINYIVTAQYKESGIAVLGAYELTCELPGTVGNEYSGNLVNITFIQGLAVAEMTTLITPARDTEEDADLRQRYMDDLNQIAFAGNTADYHKRIMEISGIGGVQIYPVWNGGGTVKLSIVDSQYNLCTDEFIKSVQQQVDPSEYGDSGLGLGIAPIGHKVTVVTPTRTNINFSMTLTMESGYTVGQVRDQVIAVLEDYMTTLRKEWDNGSVFNVYSTAIYVTRTITNIMANVPHIVNITNVRINNSAADLILTESGTLQQLPFLGTVTLN